METTVNVITPCLRETFFYTLKDETGSTMVAENARAGGIPVLASPGLVPKAIAFVSLEGST